MSVRKRPDLVTRGRARLLEDFENLNAENPVSDDASSDHAEKGPIEGVPRVRFSSRGAARSVALNPKSDADSVYFLMLP